MTRFSRGIFLSTLSLRRATVQIVIVVVHALFLSTLSLRRATDSRNGNLTSHCNFYPRSPCGERPPYNLIIHHAKNISIHALLAESDAVQIVIVVVHTLFLSTLSLRRATHTKQNKRRHTAYFYPRSPCGERPSKLAKTSRTE